jgi:hypothetical protein
LLQGLGFDSREGTWDAIDNSRILNIEAGQSMREAINNWNINTSNWLRLYVYERAHEVRVRVRGAHVVMTMTCAWNISRLGVDGAQDLGRADCGWLARSRDMGAAWSERRARKRSNAACQRHHHHHYCVGRLSWAALSPPS